MLKICSVSVEFPTRDGVIRPVDQVCVTVEDKTRHIIVGETGSGKSVLLMTILGLSGGRVQGRLEWNGTDLLSLSPQELAHLRGKEISYIPQGNANGMNPLHTIGGQVGEPLVVHEGADRTTARRRAVDALERLGFPIPSQWAKRYPHHLSGGMRQRALVAMGTIAGGRLLLADEPTKGLDELRRSEVEELFCELPDITLLCVTHDLEFARAVAQRISVMYAGQLVETCSAEEFFTRPLHPYSQMLIRSLPENGFQFPKGFAPSHHHYGDLGCRYAARCPQADAQCMTSPPMLEISGRQVLCCHAVTDKGAL